MTVREAIEELELAPLLGHSVRETLARIDQLMHRLDPDADPTLTLRLLLQRFRAAPPTARAIDQLATAEAWASAEGLELERVRLQLLWCTTIGRHFPDAVPEDMLNDAVDRARERGDLEAEWRLALAVCHPVRATTLRREALALLTSPADDAVRIQTMLDLADDYSRGSADDAALETLESAVNLADQHPTSPLLCEALIRLSFALLLRGKRTRALPALQRAHAVSMELDDDLSIVMTGAPLAAIRLDEGDLDAAERIAERMLVSGARRGNWFAVVDAHITLSAVQLRSSGPTMAIAQLVQAVVGLRDLVPAAALNLLKGRLAELRNELGAHAFDRHYSSAVQQQEGAAPVN